MSSGAKGLARLVYPVLGLIVWLGTACVEQADVLGPQDEVIQRPDYIWGAGGPCEAATSESYRWCYIIFIARLSVAPGPDCISEICWATFPWGPFSSALNGAKNALLGSSKALCQQAGTTFGELLGDDRVSYWIPKDTTFAGDTVLATTWTSGAPGGGVAIQFWRTLLLSAPQARINWETAHELYHWINGLTGDPDFDELSADAFALFCFGARPAWP